jgi:hypothetical protein
MPCSPQWQCQTPSSLHSRMNGKPSLTNEIPTTAAKECSETPREGDGFSRGDGETVPKLDYEESAGSAVIQRREDSEESSGSAMTHRREDSETSSGSAMNQKPTQGSTDPGSRWEVARPQSEQERTRSPPRSPAGVLMRRTRNKFWDLLGLGKGGLSNNVQSQWPAVKDAPVSGYEAQPFAKSYHRCGHIPFYIFARHEMY